MDTATTEIYTYWHTLSLHEALPILCAHLSGNCRCDGKWSRDFHILVRNLCREVGAESGLPHAFHGRVAGEAMAQLRRLPGSAAPGLLLVGRGRDRGDVRDAPGRERVVSHG